MRRLELRYTESYKIILKNTFVEGIDSASRLRSEPVKSRPFFTKKKGNLNLGLTIIMQNCNSFITLYKISVTWVQTICFFFIPIFHLVLTIEEETPFLFFSFLGIFNISARLYSVICITCNFLVVLGEWVIDQIRACSFVFLLLYLDLNFHNYLSQRTSYVRFAMVRVLPTGREMTLKAPWF